MDTYSILREFADSWMLLALFSFFIAVIVWVFIPFRNETKPAADAAQVAKEA